MRRSLAFTMTAAALLGGCAPTLPPVVRVADARIQDATGDGARVVVDLSLENPNDFPLPLTRVDYRVAMPDAGVSAYSAHAVPGRTLPASGTQTVTLTAGLKGDPEAWDPGAVAEQAWRVRGSVTYTPDRGMRSFLTETGVPLPTAGFHGEGRFAGDPTR